MVDGGENIVEASWESVSSMLQVVSNYHRMQLLHGLWTQLGLLFEGIQQEVMSLKQKAVLWSCQQPVCIPLSTTPHLQYTGQTLSELNKWSRSPPSGRDRHRQRSL